MESGSNDPGAGAEGPLRVLLLTPRLLDTSGGRACTDLALRLDRREFTPVVCCYAGWGPLAGELQDAGIEIFPLSRRAGLDATYVFALAHEMRHRRIDVVHALHARKAYVVGVLSGLLAGVRTGVASFRDRPVAGSRALATMGRLCGELVGTMVATSEEVRQSLLRQRWVPPGKTRVIPDGVNIERFSDPGRRGPARRHWGLGDAEPVVGAVLHHGDSEELKLLSETFAELRRELPEARLLVSGIDGGDGRMLGLGPYSDGPAFYAAIDALCVPRARRVVPLNLLEALAAGVPIAAARPLDDKGLPPEGPWAFADLTEPTSQALAKGLLELLFEPEAARQLARGGRACVAADHSIDTWVRRMQELYRP